MGIGVLIRAVALVVLLWAVILGPRAYPSLVGAWDEASLPPATLLVESTSCERPNVDSLRWTCQAGGPLTGSAAHGGRHGVYFYEIEGDEPEGRYDIDAEVRVAIVREMFGGLALLDGDRTREQAETRLRWLAQQPVWSLAAVVITWAGLVVVGWRHRPRAGVLELTTWPGAPGLALASFGLAVALAAGTWLDVALAGGIAWTVVLTGVAALALPRTFWLFDRVGGVRTRGQAFGSWRTLETGIRLGAVMEVHVFETTRIGAPWDQHRLVLAEFGGMHEIARGRPPRMKTMGQAVATYFGVPLLDPVGLRIGGAPALPFTPAPSPIEADDDEWDEDALDEGEGDERASDAGKDTIGGFDRREAVDQPAAEPFPPLPSEHRRHLDLRERWRHAPRGLAVLVVLAGVALGVAVVNTGGIDPFAARMLEPDVSVWPAGGAIRRAALSVVAWRDVQPETLLSLVRLAHTLEPADSLWRPVVRAASGVLQVDLPLDEPAEALARLDASASRALAMPLGPLGVLGWLELDPYFVESLDDLAGPDVHLAVERFNRVKPPQGLPTAEWYLAWLGRAFADGRPIHFAIVADGLGEGWIPVAVPHDQVGPDARRIGASTVGEALAVGLWGLPRYRPASPEVSVAEWWAPIATSRGLPQVAEALR